MKRKKVLICGATGFIGRNLADRFVQMPEYEVYGTYFRSKPLQNKKIRMVRVDLMDTKDMTRAVKGMDIVIQAAATTSGVKDIVQRPYLHVTDNAVMNSLLFRAAYEENVSQLIFLSCSVMYHSSSKPLLEGDFDANRPMYPRYFGVGWTKVYLEKMCEFFSRIGRTQFTVIRHSNVYGPYDKFDLEKSHVFAATLTKVMSALDGGKVQVWGDGTEERDLLYVSDLVDFILRALKRQKEKFALYNVGCGKAVSIRKLVREIIRVSRKDLQMVFDTSKPTIKTKVCLNIRKAKRSLGWMPQVSLRQGIQKTIEWYQRNIEKD